MIQTLQRRQHGLVLLVFVLLALAVALGFFFVSIGSSSIEKNRRDRTNEEVLQKAKEALIAYATARKMTSLTPMPGTLPCPDMDDDGDAETSCGNASGSTQQVNRLGRLPWKTLGLDDLRDSSGERLWYAISSKYKSNTANGDLNPSTGLGTITLRNASGTVLLDGTSADIYSANAGGAVAIVIAPGPPLQRQGDPVVQNRTCIGGSCDALGKCLTTPAASTPKCNPTNYLDIGLGEDNANFIDQNVSRAGNANGFIMGPVVVSGTTIVNDRIVAIRYSDIMLPMQQRVAQEVKSCFSAYAALSQNRNRFPWPTPICQQGGNSPGDKWEDSSSVLFGRVPDTPFTTTATVGMSEQWGATDCNIDSGVGWWPAWKKHVFYALAPAYAPSVSVPVAPCASASSCLQAQSTTGATIAVDKQIVVLVAGAPIGGQIRGGSNDANAINYLELSNLELQKRIISPLPPTCALLSPQPVLVGCSPLSSCNKATISNHQTSINDVVVYFP